MTNSVEYYVSRFSRLNTDKNHWKGKETVRERAPHKPLLLLSIIEQFREGNISANFFELTPDLSEAFHLYWRSIMPSDTHGNIALPFFHLQNDGFWRLIPKTGKDAILTSRRSIRTIIELDEVVAGAMLDEELFDLLMHEKTRNILAGTLLNTYFSDEAQQALLSQSEINVEAFKYSQELLNRAETDGEEEISSPVRSQGFRRAVITAYNHRCAMSGIRILTPDGHTAVNASHIVPWSISHNDDPTNGLALSPLCHWAFDEGLISVDQQYRIVLSPHLRRDDNIAGDLLALERRELILPDDREFWPDLEAIEYHRKKILYR